MLIVGEVSMVAIIVVVWRLSTQPEHWHNLGYLGRLFKLFSVWLPGDTEWTNISISMLRS